MNKLIQRVSGACVNVLGNSGIKIITSFFVVVVEKLENEIG